MPTDSAFLAEVPLFASLDEHERNLLAGSLEARELAAGQVVFRVGDPGDSMFIVRRGAIELFDKDTAGQKILFHTARAGDFFGELSLFDSLSRSATALVVEDAELLTLDR